jgi:ATPase subunit of ABC transporter with duplicated ATPase domains
VRGRQLKQAKQKEAKMDRIGLYREDGKAFKTHSLKTLDEDALRLPTKIHDEVRARQRLLEFPPPNPPLSLRRGAHEPVVQLNDVSVGYTQAPPYVLSGVTAQLSARSRVALVGSNGAGKSTLLGVCLSE